MAVDKLVDSTQLNTDLTSVANAIRAKSGGSGQLAFPADFVTAIADIPTGGGGSSVKYTRYTLTGDTTIKQFIDSINYEVETDTCLYIAIRVSGDVAPSTGTYTVNNYRWSWVDGSRRTGDHYYKGGHHTPNSFPNLPERNEVNNTASIVNGILTSNSTSSSPIGTTGDVVTLAEISGMYDNTIMNGGAI